MVEQRGKLQPEHNSCSLAGLTFASLGHRNSRGKEGTRLCAFHITLCFYSRDDRLHESVTGGEGAGGEGGGEREGERSDAPSEERGGR